METKTYLSLKARLVRNGYEDEINWQRDLKPCDNCNEFCDQLVWVILNSGMREQVARIIAERIYKAIRLGEDISTAFNHIGKVAAIKHILEHRERLFNAYQAAEIKTDYLETLPFIGIITKYHAAKSLGCDCVKPDRHLVRIASNYGYSDCNVLCQKLSDETGDKVSVIDIVLWRAANLGMI
jgi:hypothetical protein